MKILAIDDQRLVLLPIKKHLEQLGYQVYIENDSECGMDRFEVVKPDLVMIDINMPGINGVELISAFRAMGNNVPIMVLSGNTNDEIISRTYEIGISDYVKKPLSLNEISARVKNLIGIPEGHTNTNVSSVTIQQRCVGVVIPCYNEEERLHDSDFLSLVDSNSGYHLCFVNDGSKDRTLEKLLDLQKGREDFISVIDCEKNGGKAEAVRKGMLSMMKKPELDYIGFLDADLSTDFSDFTTLIETMENSEFNIVSGSRIHRMGANISKDSARQIISKTINLIIRTLLSMDFKDTQCGAKLFRKEVIELAFSKPFITRWLFDVEIFMRMKGFFGTKKANEMLCEVPLKRWVHADGSKLSYKDSMKIGIQLIKIGWHYNKSNSKYKVGKLDVAFE